MRIIPKKTKVAMEFFKGISILDVLVGMLGISIVVSLIFSNLPFKVWIAVIVFIIFSGSIIPVDDEKAYMMVFHAIKYFVSYKTFERESVKKGDPSIKTITPFTGVKDCFIEYGDGKYYGVVIEIPSIEFRFLTERRQNALIDNVFGSVLRTVGGDEAANIVKIDRPILYDSFVTTENRKIKELKEAYVNGLLNDEELTTRVGIIQDRINQIHIINDLERVFVPFHYLVFFSKDKEALRYKANDAIAVLGSGDMNCELLSEKELVVFLKYQYSMDFDERDVLTLKPEEYMDWIMPQNIVMNARTIAYDGVVTHSLRVTDYPTMVGNAWGASLFNRSYTRVVMKLKPTDRFKGIRQIDRAIDELREQAGTTGKTSRLMELDTHIDTLTEVLALLQGDNEVLFNVDIFVTVFDDELTEHLAHPDGKKAPVLNSIKKQVKRSLSEEGFRSADGMWQQFEMYASGQVSSYDAYVKQSRGIHSGSVAATFPFVYKSLSDPEGICLGDNDGRPVFVDFFIRDRERVNSNTVIIGKSGSGKSYATKTLLANLAADNSKIFILDPENEYTALANNLDGKIIDVGSATQGRLNPFHIITSLSDEDDEDTVNRGSETSDDWDDDETEKSSNTSFHMHLQFLEEFYRQILPGIESDALEYLNNITLHMYEAKGIHPDTDLGTLGPSDYPIFDDLYEAILNDYQLATGDYSKSNLRILLNYISKFSTGGRNALLWNGEASINTNENFIVFNFQSLLANKNNTIANAQMLLVLKWLDNEIIKNRDYNLRYGASRKIVVVIDEAHVFIDSKFPIALDFMYQLAKRIRKYNGMQIIITQNIKDFVGTEELARKSTAIINACQYSFIFPLSPNDMHDLCKLYEKAGAINESEQDEIINNGRGRAFVITSPANRSCVNIVAPADIERLFTQ
ncbi:MAG: ATP-binding protein [Clostridium sp.]